MPEPDTIELELNTHQYDTDDDGELQLRYLIRTSIFIDKTGEKLEVSTQEFSGPTKSHEEYYNLKVDLQDNKQIEDIYKFIDKSIKKELGATRSLRISVENAELFDAHHSRTKTNEEITISIGDNQVQFVTTGGGQPHISYHSKSVDLEPQDEENIVKLRDLFAEGSGNLDSRDSFTSSEPLIGEKILENVNKSQYYDELASWIEEGDRCLGQDLYRSALGAYVHAIEWAIISYLEGYEGRDLIEVEKSEGKYYSFPGGYEDILDELQEFVDLDQKTESKLKSMNEAERRWVAHHKSGKTLPEEVKAVRSRLHELLKKLFTG